MNDDNRVVLHFNPSGKNKGKIFKEVFAGEVEITVNEAKAHWLNMNIKDSNVAFRRLPDNDWDVAKALESYDV